MYVYLIRRLYSWIRTVDTPGIRSFVWNNANNVLFGMQYKLILNKKRSMYCCLMSF